MRRARVAPNVQFDLGNCMFSILPREAPMSVGQQQLQSAVQRERTEEAFSVKEPIENPRIAPRLIPVIVTVLIGLAIIAVLFFLPR
jgi:hypothetical protein